MAKLCRFCAAEKDAKTESNNSLLGKKNWRDIYHLVFLPTFKEGVGIIRSTFQGLTQINYPLNKLIVVLAGEEADKEHFLQNAAIIKKEFGDNFFRFLVTLHPKNLPDEIPGKGSNTNYAGRRAKELIDELDIPYENIIVSDFDIDTVVHPEYFACLAYKYLTVKQPHNSSYQPVTFYNNNIWSSSAIVRVASFGTTFWLLAELARPDRLCTFSSHSMSFRALQEVGFRQKDIISDDSRIFYQCLLRYKGNYSVVPIYIPVSMNTVQVRGRLRSLINLYNQQKRWAWGVENLPFILWNFFFCSRKTNQSSPPLGLQKEDKQHTKNNTPKIRNRSGAGKVFPFWKKIKHTFILAEGMYSWATAPILIFMLGRISLWVADSNLNLKTLSIVQNTPFTLEFLMNVAMIGILVSAILSVMLLPPRPEGKKAHMFLTMFLQWALLPVTFVVFGAFPAIDAQTRLMLGKGLRFRVTEKENG